MYFSKKNNIELQTEKFKKNSTKSKSKNNARNVKNTLYIQKNIEKTKINQSINQKETGIRIYRYVLY